MRVDARRRSARARTRFREWAASVRRERAAAATQWAQGKVRQARRGRRGRRGSAALICSELPRDLPLIWRHRWQALQRCAPPTEDELMTEAFMRGGSGRLAPRADGGSWKAAREAFLDEARRLLQRERPVDLALFQELVRHGGPALRRAIDEGGLGADDVPRWIYLLLRGRDRLHVWKLYAEYIYTTRERSLGGLRSRAAAIVAQPASVIRLWLRSSRCR